MNYSEDNCDFTIGHKAPTKDDYSQLHEAYSNMLKALAAFNFIPDGENYRKMNIAMDNYRTIFLKVYPVLL